MLHRRMEKTDPLPITDPNGNGKDGSDEHKRSAAAAAKQGLLAKIFPYVIIFILCFDRLRYQHSSCQYGRGGGQEVADKSNERGSSLQTAQTTGNNGQAPTQGAFESALNEVTQLISDERTKNNISAERTRQDFNLTMWDKRTTGGLKDLDRIKLAAIYRNATSVFEWGLGESSFIAAKVGVPRYTGIDSDPTWIKAARDSSPDHFRFHLGDIGPTGHWGRPDRSRLKKSYLNYQFEPLVSEKAFDVYYVDGRMRPACALVAFLHASTRGKTEEEKSPIVIIHDYYHDKMSQNCSECRKFRWQYPYHRIEEVADLVDHSGAMLAVFKRKKGVTDWEIKALWQEMGLGDT